jgi:hypothetical protein
MKSQGIKMRSQESSLIRNKLVLNSIKTKNESKVATHFGLSLLISVLPHICSYTTVLSVVRII